MGLHATVPTQRNCLESDTLSRKQKIEQHRKALPIAAVEKILLEEVINNDVLIIVGETGSGKTTQLPQYLFDGGLCRNGGIIGITQPRRVAAVTVAKRVAEECGVKLGQKVGYSIRFEDVTSNATRIKYMTDGLLLREALIDPYLSRYSVIIVDEAHERTVQTDVLLGLLKKVQKIRSQGTKDDIACNDRTSVQIIKSLVKENGAQSNFLTPLKLIIMSASLNAQIFSSYFDGARIVPVEGRQYPVARLYTCQPGPVDYAAAALDTVFQLHAEEAHGGILVFLTGQDEIESFERLAQERLLKLNESKRKLLFTPIYAALPSEKQMKAFLPSPSGFRKVVLATNIAETSVTIPGIKYVIDPGRVKVRMHDACTRVEQLVIVKTSKAQALQRSGRAGREGPGKCYRLYSEDEFYELEDSSPSEIKRCNLSSIILQLKALGIDDIAGFDFIEKPDRMAVIKSMEVLFLLGALVEDGKLSDPVGLQMARLPLDPIYSKSLIVATQFGCLEEMLIIVAMLSVESIFYVPRAKQEEARTALRNFSSTEGDHLTLLNVYRASADFLEKRKLVSSDEKAEKSLRKWCKENFINGRSLNHARNVLSQIQKHIEQMGLHVTSCGDDMLPLQKCLAASFYLNAALKQPDGSYRTVGSGLAVQIHASSVLFRKKAECIVFDELMRTDDNYVRNVSRIDYLWLPELARLRYDRPVQNTAFNLAEQWVNSMTKYTANETSARVEWEGRPPRLGVGAAVVKQSKFWINNERKLIGKLHACKRKEVTRTSAGDDGDGMSEDEELDSKTKAFTKKALHNPSKKKLRIFR